MKVLRMWDSETDYLVDNIKPLLSKSDYPNLDKYFNTAYSLNTSIGLFHYSELKTETKQRNLILDCGKVNKCIMKNIYIWPQDYFNRFMIFSKNDTKQTFLIDLNGIIYELPCSSKYDQYGYGTSEMRIDKINMCYFINGVKVYYSTKQEREEFIKNTQPNMSAIFNKKFNAFVRNNAHNNTPYLYLTVDGGKKGSIINYCISNGMEYEIVPNLFVDDDTINIRIPINGSNSTRKDINFLCAKYRNDYSIYHISYSNIARGLIEEDKTIWNKVKVHGNYILQKNKENIAFEIINTLKFIFNIDNPWEIFKKTISKIEKMFDRGRYSNVKNEFTDVLIKSIYDIDNNYIINNIESINLILSNIQENPLNWTDWMNRNDNWDTLDDLRKIRENENKFRNSYNLAYKESVRKYKENMQIYENSILKTLVNNGVKISKWNNEVNMYTVILKEYPDAIYQYRSDWLNKQSLDVFVPSLNIGFEYQGEQHYHPVDFFGGEEGYKNTIERDKRKFQICKKHNVSIIYWKYDEIINKNNLIKKILELQHND